jgi:outer membrane murein-binding lipoprotein Lpp
VKIRAEILGILTAGCVMGIALPSRATAEVSDDDFNKLKTVVEQLSQKVEALEKTHEEDQQEIQRLQAQPAKAENVTANGDYKAEATAQPPPPPTTQAPSGPLATHDFTLVGDAEVQYGKVHGQHGAFALADFAPIFLYRAADNVLFEVGVDIRLQNNAPNGGGATTTFDLSFAQLDFLYNDYVTVVAGLMVLPLGTYSERAAGWLNKIPDDPLARDFLPGNGVGVQLRGAIPVGQSGASFTYSAYGVNGPGSVDGSGNADQLDLGGNVGIKSDGNMANLHSNPSGGGRLAFFVPFNPHYDVELGVSGQGGEWDNAGNRLWSGLVVDGAVHISPFFEVKGEYINTWVGTDDMGTIRPHGGWVQAGYKLAGLNLDVEIPLIKISNIELVSRYDTANDGMRHHLGTNTDRETVGFVYYLTNTLWFEGDYEWLQSHGPNELPPRDYVFQLSYGF